MPFWTDLKNRILGALPNIGTHGGIEAEMLLAKRKPLGWMYVPRVLPDVKIENLPPAFQKEIRDHERLGEAVKRGDLVSKDVVTRETLPDGSTLTSVFRHYAQPGKEKTLDAVAAFNEKAFNRQPLNDVMLKEDIGKILGYRKRDRFMWNNMHRLPRVMQDALITLNHKFIRDAYQANELRKADKIIKKQARKPAPRPGG
jgi:hypothetical protein